MTSIQLLQVHVGTPAPLGGRRGEVVISGIRKKPVQDAVLAVSHTNIAGDGQADLNNHGGPDKAVYCYSADNLPFWQESIGYEGDGVHAAFGQNLTVSGVDETMVCIGDTWRWGDVVLQVSQPRWPCFKLNMHSGVTKLSNALIHSGRSGWYLRVLETGDAPASGIIELIERDPLGLTVREAFEVRGNPKMDPDRYREIMAHPKLAQAWST
jgi:MOSC domain-containing protein YiiM